MTTIEQVKRAFWDAYEKSGGIYFEELDYDSDNELLIAFYASLCDAINKEQEVET